MAEHPIDLTKRPAHLAKGEWGRLLILAGSSQLAGAAVLNMLGATRTGLDTVVVAAPERAANAVLHTNPTVISLAIPRRSFEPVHLKFIQQFERYPVAMGSGMTVHRPVEKFVKGVLKRFAGPFVLDADALRIVAMLRNPTKLWQGKAVVLTPNRGEYAALAGRDDAEPLETIQQLARKLNVTILCKGPTDVVSDGQAVAEVTGGSQFLAGAGSGDVLTGVVGALLARGLGPLEACLSGSRLLKDASERAEAQFGPGMTASDVPAFIDVRRLRSEPTSNEQPPEASTTPAT